MKPQISWITWLLKTSGIWKVAGMMHCVTRSVTQEVPWGLHRKKTLFYFIFKMCILNASQSLLHGHCHHKSKLELNFYIFFFSSPLTPMGNFMTGALGVHSSLRWCCVLMLNLPQSGFSIVFWICLPFVCDAESLHDSVCFYLLQSSSKCHSYFWFHQHHRKIW